MGKVIPFTGVTVLDMEPQQILEQAQKEAGKMEGIVLMGFTKDGSTFFTSSYADGGTVLWLIEQMKKQLLDVEVTVRDK